MSCTSQADMENLHSLQWMVWANYLEYEYKYDPANRSVRFQTGPILLINEKFSDNTISEEIGEQDFPMLFNVRDKNSKVVVSVS